MLLLSLLVGSFFLMLLNCTLKENKVDKTDYYEDISTVFLLQKCNNAEFERFLMGKKIASKIINFYFYGNISEKIW